MRALSDLDDALERLHTTLDDLDRRVTCLKRAMYGWGLILTAEVLVGTGVVLWWGWQAAKAAKAEGRLLECLNSSVGVALVSGAIMVLVWIVIWWLHRRDLRRMRSQRDAHARQLMLQPQWWDLEEQIRGERWSDEERAWRRPCRERQAEVTRGR